MSDVLCPKCHRKRRIPLEDPLCRGCYLKLIQKPINLSEEAIKDLHYVWNHPKDFNGYMELKKKWKERKDDK